MITMKPTSQQLAVNMASITIRNLDDDVKARLRIAAARHGCSMEEEVRRILRRTLTAEDSVIQLGTRIHERFTELGGFDLTEPDRTEPRTAPDFSDSQK